jgi:hypothetical protein
MGPSGSGERGTRFGITTRQDGAAGRPQTYIQAQLGHAWIQTTLDRDGHLMSETHWPTTIDGMAVVSISVGAYVRSGGTATRRLLKNPRL